MKITAEHNHYNTKDTALAAWLLTQGFKLLDIDMGNYPYGFRFEDTASLREAVRLWDLMQGEAEIVQRYHHNYRELLDKIHPKVGRL